MLKSGKTLKRFGFVLFVTAIAVLNVALVSYWVGQSRQRAIQEGILSGTFTKVQPQNGKVVFVPSKDRVPLQVGSSDMLPEK